jgi:beta-galactosidase GanA
MRFVSDTWRSYQKNQADGIRAFSNRQFVTANLMGWFGGFDHYTVTQDLDLAAWDDYVPKGHLDPVDNGAAHDLTRGLLRRNFWVMEMQAGSGSFDKSTVQLTRVKPERWRGTLSAMARTRSVSGNGEVH